ncbi:MULTISPECIES: S8 family peptidase [unclassified Clostridium]|uniref:S8 family peptidase n=1 Tax=unclassified Clostridium TaxID=2614128 RepID=UPI003216C876
MINSRDCSLYYDESVSNFLVQYKNKDEFKEQIDKIPYACGDVITDNLAVVAVSHLKMNRLLKEVPQIIFFDFRKMFVLGETSKSTSPPSVGNINSILINPYLNLTGRGVLIGIVDTGIDYLNNEFIREDDTSRIVSLWDQTISNNSSSTYMGTTYSNEQINAAIKAYRNNEDPYTIVPSKDTIGHGTQVAGIIGARGNNSDVRGIANDSDFVIVKLFESTNFRKALLENGVEYTPVYNASEIVSGIEYLKNVAIELKRPMVIYLGLGSTESSHDGTSLISRYVSSIGTIRGICLVSGVGNEGAAQTHATGYIKNKTDPSSLELRITKEMKFFTFNIWVKKPNRASLVIVSPTGESSSLLKSKDVNEQNTKFVFLNTRSRVLYFNPEHFTGHEVIHVEFYDIKPGIWTFRLIGEYLIDGRYDIWLQPHNTLPGGTEFLQPNPLNTLTEPSTAVNVVTVSYYGEDNALISTSGRGFNTNNLINPDIATLGTNILTTKVTGGTTTMSGSSAATAIVAGACAILLEWGIINGNDQTMYSQKIRSYLMHGAARSSYYRFPNQELGYGYLDLLGVFNFISRSYSTDISLNRTNTCDECNKNDDYIVYTTNNVFIRIPKCIVGDFI